MKIGFIGVGELSEKLIRGLLNVLHSSEIYLSPRNSARVDALAASDACTVMPSNQAVVDMADILVLGVRPNALMSVAAEITLRPEQTLVSLLAGVSRPTLQQAFGVLTPVRMMLTYAAEINKTTVVLTGCPTNVETLFSCLGETLILDEEAQFELATVGMCMNGWFYAFAAQLQSWFIEKGLAPDEARRLVLGGLRDCAEYGRYHTNHSLDDLAKSIATPGTFTALGQDTLDQMQAIAPWTTAAESVFAALSENKDNQ